MMKVMQCLIMGLIFISQLQSYPDTIRLIYDIGATTLTDNHKSSLVRALDLIDAADSVSVSIVGSADYLGNVTLNRRISDQRVSNVTDLVSERYSEVIDVLTIDSKGEVNSHLENQLGPDGSSRDRSVVLIIDRVLISQMAAEKDTPLTTTNTEELSELDIGHSLILENLNFHPGSHKLLSKSIPVLQRLSEELKKHPHISFEIEGHICCFANQTKAFQDHNDALREADLPERRAANIYNYLVLQGIDSTRIKMEAAPVVYSQLEGRPEDHRAARMVLVKMDGGPVELASSLRSLDLTFNLGRSVLIKESIPMLRSLLAALQRDRSIHITLVGHSCCTPECTSTLIDGYNSDTARDDLSISRARVVYNYLKKEGIDPRRMTYQGYAYSRPMIFPERSEEDQISNRRVVIRITDTKL